LSAGIAATLLTVPPASAEDEDELRQRRSAVTDRIASAGEHVEESSKELAAATRRLERVQARLSRAQVRLAQTREEWAAAVEYEQLIEQRLADAEARLVSAEEALVLGRLEVKQAEDRLAQFVVTSSQYGDPSVVALDTILSGADPSLLSQNLALTDSIFGSQVASIDELEAARARLIVHEEAVQTIRDEVEEQRDEAVAVVARKKEIKTRALTERREVRALVIKQVAARRDAAAARRADIAQLRALERERDELSARLRRLAIREAAAAEKAAAAATAVPPNAGGVTGSSGTSRSGAFLMAPVVAPITSEYGMRLHPILNVYKLHDGTTSASAAGLRCSPPPLVKWFSAYGSEGYGNQLVLNHGTVNGQGLADVVLSPDELLRITGRLRPAGRHHWLLPAIRGTPPAATSTSWCTRTAPP
jgi:septal ring factor EnvC (AmiA/AmiB activator)